MRSMDYKRGSRLPLSISDKCCGRIGTYGAHLGRQHLQRQTTLVALAAQEGGNQSVHGSSVAQPRGNRSYDRVNSCWAAILLGMLSVLWEE